MTHSYHLPLLLVVKCRYGYELEIVMWLSGTAARIFSPASLFGSRVLETVQSGSIDIGGGGAGEADEVGIDITTTFFDPFADFVWRCWAFLVVRSNYKTAGVSTWLTLNLLHDSRICCLWAQWEVIARILKAILRFGIFIAGFGDFSLVVKIDKTAQDRLAHIILRKCNNFSLLLCVHLIVRVAWSLLLYYRLLPACNPLAMSAFHPA